MKFIRPPGGIVAAMVAILTLFLAVFVSAADLKSDLSQPVIITATNYVNVEFGQATMNTAPADGSMFSCNDQWIWNFDNPRSGLAVAYASDAVDYFGLQDDFYVSDIYTGLELDDGNFFNAACLAAHLDFDLRSGFAVVSTSDAVGLFANTSRKYSGYDSAMLDRAFAATASETHWNPVILTKAARGALMPGDMLVSSDLRQHGHHRYSAALRSSDHDCDFPARSEERAN